MRPMSIDEIGSGKVLRALTIGDQRLPRGSALTHEQLATMPTANRNALIENRFIAVYPTGTVVAAAAPAQATGELMAVPRGFGKYDVIRGTVIASGLTKDEATATVAKAAAVPPVKGKSRDRKKAAA